MGAIGAAVGEVDRGKRYNDTYRQGHFGRGPKVFFAPCRQAVSTGRDPLGSYLSN